jgi:hypothetical protein
MARRAALVVMILIGVSLTAGSPQAAPWFKRADPDITTHLFVYRTHLTLLDRRLGVYPFVIAQGGEPRPPEFAPLLTQALLQEGSAASVTHVPGAPWDQTPDWEASRWNEASRIAAVAADGRERGFDFVVLGRVDSFFRTAAQGLTAKVSVWLISTQDGAVVWYGSKKAEWLRRYSVEECVLRLAWSFATDWRPPRP